MTLPSPTPTGATAVYLAGFPESKIGVQSKVMYCTLEPENAETETTFESSDESIITLSKLSDTQVIVTGLQASDTPVTITATNNGHSDSVEVTCIEGVVPNYIAFNGGRDIQIVVNDTDTLTLYLPPYEDEQETTTMVTTDTTFTSSDDTIVSVTKVSNTEVTIAGLQASDTPVTITATNSGMSDSITCTCTLE